MGSTWYKSYPPTWTDYGVPDDYSDYSEQCDMPAASTVCHYDKHKWVDTGMKKTWCKVCDIEGEWTSEGWQVKAGQ